MLANGLCIRWSVYRINLEHCICFPMKKAPPAQEKHCFSTLEGLEGQESKPEGGLVRGCQSFSVLVDQDSYTEEDGKLAAVTSTISLFTYNDQLVG